jgi:hypothetical protein
MNGTDAKARLIAAFVNDALVHAMLKELLVGPALFRVAQDAIAHLPPEPDRGQDPSLHDAWLAAKAELKKIGGIG